MRRFTLVFAIILASCGPGGGDAVAPKDPIPSPTSTPTPAPAKKENFVVILVDDLLLSDFLTSTATPTLDRLGDQGLILRNFHTTTPICTPSRFTLLTGRRASESRSDAALRRIRKDGMPVPEFNALIIEDDLTLPKMLQSAGYTTGFVGKNHVVEVKGLPDFPTPAILGDPETEQTLKDKDEIVRSAISRVGFDFVSRVYNEGSPVESSRVPELQVHNLDWITAGAVEFIEQNKDAPFFLFMALTVPHIPDDPESSWAADRRYTPVGLLDKAPGLLMDAETLTAKAPGRENLRWMDDAVRVVWRTLSENRLDGNTTLIFLSDHGQIAKGSIYDGGTRTPALVWRDDMSGAQSNSLVSNLDLAPTVLTLAGIDGLGSGFAQLLTNPNIEIHDALLFDLGYTRGVLKDDWKYIAFRLPERLRGGSPDGEYYHFSGKPGGSGAERRVQRQYPSYYDADQLYYLREDPREQRNIYQANEDSSIVWDLKGEISAEFGGRFAEF